MFRLCIFLVTEGGGVSALVTSLNHIIQWIHTLFTSYCKTSSTSMLFNDYCFIAIRLLPLFLRHLCEVKLEVIAFSTLRMIRF